MFVLSPRADIFLHINKMCGSDYSSTTTTDRPTTWVVFSNSPPPFLSTLFHRCSIPIPHQQPPPFPLAVSLAHRFVQSSQSVILMLEHSLMRTTLHVQFSFEWLGKWTLIGNIFDFIGQIKVHYNVGPNWQRSIREILPATCPSGCPSLNVKWPS